jgi:hypothetical protein
MLRLGLADRAVARFELFLKDIEEQSAAVVPYRVVLWVPLEEGGDLLEGGVCEFAGFDLERGVSLSSTRDLVSELQHTFSATSLSRDLYCSICLRSFSLAASLLSTTPETRGTPCWATVNLTSHACTRTYSFLHYLRLPWKCVTTGASSWKMTVKSDVGVWMARRGQRWRARRCPSHGLERISSLHLVSLVRRHIVVNSASGSMLLYPVHRAVQSGAPRFSR